MDADQKLTALKKAYVDIILNISKEAAARVMSSERRAMRYQHELNVVKEEALRMLLRLKQMMDCKSGEAATVSLNQQKKMAELEAQLHEAEDIVKDLREELGEMQSELDRVKNENLQYSNVPGYAFSREEYDRNYSKQSSQFLHLETQNKRDAAPEAKLPSLSERNEHCSRCMKIVCTCSSSFGTGSFTSIISRGQECGPYRNGCTQRIHACEKNILNNDFCVLGETDSVKDKNNDAELENIESTCKEPASQAKAWGELEEPLLADMKLSSCQPFYLKKKRAITKRKATTLSWNQVDLIQKPHHDLSEKYNPVSVKDTAHSCESPSTQAPILSADNSETQNIIGHTETSGKETNFLEILGELTSQNSDGLVEQMVPQVEGTGFVERLLTHHTSDVGMQSSNVDPNSLETRKGLPSPPAKGRFFKYTFQRKRKREALSVSESNLSLRTEEETGNKKYSDQKLEASKSSFLIESSRDSRRMAQVARQLISLSEKKWWD